MVMLESLHEHSPEAVIHVLCLSEECLTAMRQLAYPYVSLIPLSELEAADPELAAVRGTRSLVEYYFTITPCFPWFLLNERNLDEVTYLDADMMFFASPEPLFEEAGDASVIITPHRFSPALAALEKYGKYNVSWMTFRSTSSGRACLHWYREACLDWCCDELEEMRFADQKYLDFFSEKFPGVHSMQHAGGGVAPWNIEGTKFSERGGVFFVNNDPWIFYHAQGFKHIAWRFYASGLLPYAARLNSPALKKILTVYTRAYGEASKRSNKLIHLFDFHGIRSNKKTSLAPLRNLKRILVEAFHNSLVLSM